MLVNAAFWAMGMEKNIKPNNNIAFVGPYQPTTFNFDGYKAKVKPPTWRVGIRSSCPVK